MNTTAEQVPWSGLLTLESQHQSLSAGCSPFHPVSGLQYIVHQDILFVALFDGPIHLVYNFSWRPSWVNPTVPSGAVESVTSQSYAPTSLQLSKLARSVVFRVQTEELSFLNANTFHGMVFYDDAGALVWFHEYVLSLRCHVRRLTPRSCRVKQPSTFSYKQESGYNGMMVVTQLWTPNSASGNHLDELIIRDLKGVVDGRACGERFPSL
jgi:general transcription factor 3C polypeptide 4